MKRTAAERRMALNALVLLAASRFGLAFLPFRWVQRGVRLLAWFVARPASMSDPVAAVAWGVGAAARRLPGHTGCLPEALAAHHLLARLGVPTDLRMGARRAGGHLSAHAWVEHDGKVIVGALDELLEYQVLATEGDRRMRAFAALLRGQLVGWQEFGTNETSFLAACAEQDLTALVHRALSARGDSWPETVISSLARAARAGAAIEIVRAREIRRVLDALAAAGVRPIALKGTALAYSVYPDPTLRPRNDTDLLVRRGEIAEVKRALGGLGYRATNYSGGEQLFRQFELQRVDEFGETHALDIHWEISTEARFADLLIPGDVDETAVPIPALGAHARTLGLAEALLLACVHPAMHHRNEERLIWLYDVHLLSAHMSPVDWDRFGALALRKAVAAICIAALRRSTTRLGTAVPEPTLARLREAATRGEPTARYLLPGRAWADELAASLSALSWGRRLRLLREVAFPAPGYMLSAYGVSGWLAPALLPALYAHRGARGVWKVLTGRK